MGSKSIRSKLGAPKRAREKQTGTAPSTHDYGENSAKTIFEDHDPPPSARMMVDQSERARMLGLLRTRCWNAAIRHQLCSNLVPAKRMRLQPRAKCTPTGSSAGSTACEKRTRRYLARCPKLRYCAKPEAQSNCKRITFHVCTRLPGCNCARCREEEDNPGAPANDPPFPLQVDVPELNTGTARGVKLLPFPEVRDPEWEPGGVPAAPKLGPARAPSVDIVPPLLPRGNDAPSNGNLVEDPSIIIEKPNSPMLNAPERRPKPEPKSLIPPVERVPPENLVPPAPPLLPVKRIYHDPKPALQRQPELRPAPHRRHGAPPGDLPRPKTTRVTQGPASAPSESHESPLVPIHIRPPRAHTPRSKLNSERGLPSELSCDLRNNPTCGACTSEGTENPACDPLMVAQFLKAKAGNAAAVELLTAATQSSSRGHLLGNPLHDPRTQQQYDHQQIIRHQRFNIMRNILGLLLKSRIKAAGRSS